MSIDLSLGSSRDRAIEGHIELIAQGTNKPFTANGDHSQVIQTYEDAMKKDPINYWLWYNLCRLYATTNNLDGAIHACELGIKKFSANPSPLMELTNLYSVKGGYKAAITTRMRLLKVKSTFLLLALKDTKDPLITPTSLENKLKSSLEW